HHADRLTPPAAERNGNHLPGREAGGAIDLSIVPRVFMHLGRQSRSAGLKHCAGDATVPPNGGTACNRFLSDRIVENQLPCLMVCKEDGSCLGVNFFQGDAESCFYQLIEVNGVKKGVTHPFDGGKLSLAVGEVRHQGVEGRYRRNSGVYRVEC